MNCRYRWLLFDLDDTLLDYDKTEQHALQAACAEQKIVYMDTLRESYRKINKALWRLLEEGAVTTDEIRVKRFEDLAEEFGLDVDTDRMSESYLDAFASTHFVVDGAVDLLNSVKGSFSLAVVTNGIRETQLRRLAQTGLDIYFDHVITSEDAGSAKPDTGFFHYLSSQIEYYDKKGMLIIGDNPYSDILGGINFGIDTCWYNPDKRVCDDILPTYEVDTLHSLLTTVCI